MHPSIRTKRFGVVAALAGILLLVAGCDAATKRAPATTTTPATGTSPGAGHPAGDSVVHITDYADNDAAKSAVILTGAIGDYGQAVTVKANGTADAEHSDELNLRLTHGSFRLRIADLDKKLVNAFTRFPSNTTTCSGLVSVAGQAPIVNDSGTGSYAGISGSFDLTVSIDEVDAKTGCTASSKFLSQAIVITGWGTVSHS